MAGCVAARTGEQSAVMDDLAQAVGARRWRESIPLRVNYVFIGVVILLQCHVGTALATAWDYGCESAISTLTSEQQEVEFAHSDLESAKSEMESARSTYNLCTPSRYDDCDFERMTLSHSRDHVPRRSDRLQHVGDRDCAEGDGGGVVQ